MSGRLGRVLALMWFAIVAAVAVRLSTGSEVWAVAALAASAVVAGALLRARRHLP
jgi:hypothetical protein